MHASVAMCFQYLHFTEDHKMWSLEQQRTWRWHFRKQKTGDFNFAHRTPDNLWELHVWSNVLCYEGVYKPACLATNINPCETPSMSKFVPPHADISNTMITQLICKNSTLTHTLSQLFLWPRSNYYNKLLHKVQKLEFDS